MKSEGRGSSGVIRLAGVAPVQMDIAGAHIPGGDAGIGVPGRCAYVVQRRVAAVQLNVRPVEFVAAEDVAPRARTERSQAWLPLGSPMIDTSAHAGRGVDDPAHGPACRPSSLCRPFPSEASSRVHRYMYPPHSA